MRLFVVSTWTPPLKPPTPPGMEMAVRDGATLPVAMLALLNTRIERRSATYRRSFPASSEKSKKDVSSIVLGPVMIRSTATAPGDGFEFGLEPIAVGIGRCEGSPSVTLPTKILLAATAGGELPPSPPPPPQLPRTPVIS